MQFVFLGGLHKSGTSLLHRLLRAHPPLSVAFTKPESLKMKDNIFKAYTRPTRRMAAPDASPSMSELT